MELDRPSEGALLILRDADETREWALGDGLTIGRDDACAICLPDRQISRHHATITHTPDGFVIEDLGSKNGTWVNSVPVDVPTALHDGDEINVAARYKLYFVDAEATAPLVFEGRGLRIDEESMTVYVNGETLEPPLSLPQYELLALIYKAGGAIVTREDIIGAVWPESEAEGVSEDAIDALVRRLRMRLSEADSEHSYILTVRGYGFRLDSP